MDIFVTFSKTLVNINYTNRNIFTERMIGEETIKMNANRQYSNNHFICNFSRILRNHILETEVEFGLELKQTNKQTNQ